jgi:MarR family transcriptional regulator, transcriptional regulator for hemolysin
MMQRSKNREILFLISDVGRLLRTYADQKARHFGMTRAQWGPSCCAWNGARA